MRKGFFQSKWIRAALVALICLCFLMCIQLMAGGKLFASSAYNSYMLQALRWREGHIALKSDVPHLELAIYQGKYYVSFPPVPTIPLYFLTFIFGEHVPDIFLTQVYASLACAALFLALAKVMEDKKAAPFSFLLIFASSFLPILQNGGVWYQAQSLAMLTIMVSFAFFAYERMTPALFFYALSVGCRPFHALYGPLLMILYLARYNFSKRSFQKLLPGVVFGLMVAGAYAAYNFIRFGSVFEFGHNYLPEFSFQGGKQFSLTHVKNNFATFVLKPPFYVEGNAILGQRFGSSFILSNGPLLLLLFWALRTGLRRRLSWRQGLLLITFFLHCLLFLMHRTGGGYQWGARYFADCLPYAALWLLTGEDKTEKIGSGAFSLLSVMFAAAIFGTLITQI